MWLHIKFVKQVRQKKIHLAPSVQDMDGKSNSLENPACMKLTEPSLAESLPFKTILQAVYWEEREEGEMGERRIMNMNKRKTTKNNSACFPLNKAYRYECNQSR